MKASKILSAALAAVMALSAAGIGFSASAAKKAIKTVKAANSSKGIVLRWTAVKGAKYKVYRGRTLIKKSLKTNTFTDKKAASGKTYTYKIKVSKGKTAVGSASVKATRLAKPRMLGAAVKEKGVYISWAKVKGATKYVIFRRTAGQKNYSRLSVTEDVVFTDDSVPSGKKAVYKIKAYTSVTKMFSAFSGTKTSGIFLCAPGFRQAAFVTTDGSVRLEWDAVPGATSYDVLKAKDITSTDCVKLATVTETSFTDGGYNNPALLNYMVVARYGNICSGKANAYAFVIPEGCYFTDSDKNLNVNINLKQGEEYSDGEILVSMIDTAGLLIPDMIYGIETVSGDDVIAVSDGVITAVKPGKAQLKITLTQTAGSMLDYYLDTVRDNSALKLGNRLETGVVLVNITVE